MHAHGHIDEDPLVDGFVQRVIAAGHGAAARNVFRDRFNELRCRLSMYPSSGSLPSATFESAATTARMLGARCLPLGIAVAMHLYPLCALQCIPLPLMSSARFKRAILLRTIRDRSLILANAGSERVQGANQPLVATPCADGFRIDGTCEYMSLASVADVVLFEAKLLDRECAVLCAADLKGESVRIGQWKFTGRMRLSDTSSATFVGHRVPRGRYLLAPYDHTLRCVSDYQRCWFHLFLAEINLARLERLHAEWRLPPSAELGASVSAARRLRQHSLELLDNFSSNADIAALMRSTSALKLHVSVLAQSTAAALRSLDAATAADAERLSADADELCYIRSQPTADEKILRSHEWSGTELSRFTDAAFQQATR